MKRSLFLKTFCCLLALCLLSGCTTRSQLLAHADDGLEEIEYVTVNLQKHTAFSVENAEGDYVRNVPLVPDDPEDSRLKADGTMDFDRVDYDDGYTKIKADPSRYLIVHCDRPEEDKDEIAGAKVFFHGEDRRVEQRVLSLWDKVVCHCNNVIEIYGEPSEATVEFNIMDYDWGGDSPSDAWKIFSPNNIFYEMNGEIGEYAVVAMVNDEIIVKGALGDYTVRTYQPANSPEYNHQRELLVEKRYNKYGKLLSTTEE